MTDRRFVNSETPFEGWPRDNRFVTNTPNTELNPVIMVVGILKRNGFDIEVRPEAVDISGRPVENCVAIYADPQARSVYNKLQQTSELKVLWEATSYIAPPTPIDFDNITWGAVTRRRVSALKLKTSAEYWSRAAKHSSSGYRKKVSEIDAQKAKDLLPPHTKHLNRAQVYSLVLEVALRELRKAS